MLGALLSNVVGAPLRLQEGVVVGITDGKLVLVGASDGGLDGKAEGNSEGRLLGPLLGAVVGPPLLGQLVGAAVGITNGDLVGNHRRLARWRRNDRQ